MIEYNTKYPAKQDVECVARIRELMIYSNAGKGHGAAEDAAYALFLKAVCGIGWEAL